MTGLEHGETVMLLGAELVNFVRERKLGRIVGSDTGVIVRHDPREVREPDIAFFSAERLPLGTRIVGPASIPPDLVVEVFSPNDRDSDMKDKVRMWLGDRCAPRLGRGARPLPDHCPPHWPSPPDPPRRGRT